MINNLQSFKEETKIDFYKNLSNFCDIMKIRMDEDPYSKNAQGIGKNYHEVLMLMKFIQTKPQVKIMDVNYYDLFYKVIKNRDE